MPEVEQHGNEPVPQAERTAGLRDQLTLAFCFNLTPLNIIFGALAVKVGHLPLPWAVGGIALGTLLGASLILPAAIAGVDEGLPGQVSMRATFGNWGARVLTSPYRVLAATYWFAGQAIAAALGFQALFRGLVDVELPLVPIALAIAAFQGVLAVAGFDVMRFFVRLVLPLMLVSTGVLIALEVGSDRSAFGLGRVLDSPQQTFTWVGFAGVVTSLIGAHSTNVTNIADFCRYASSRRAACVGYVGGSVGAATIAAWVGAYAAVATGALNPFVAAVELTSVWPVLLLLLVAIALQGAAVNVVNCYTSGLSLLNALPRLGRLVATSITAGLGLLVAAFPSFVDDALKWMTHLGNVATPLAGVVVADVLRRRARLDVRALYERDGPYRYLRGVNPAAVLALAGGVAVYYTVPAEWLKAAWGIGVAGGLYLALMALQKRRAQPGAAVRRPLAGERAF